MQILRDSSGHISLLVFVLLMYLLMKLTIFG